MIYDYLGYGGAFLILCALSADTNDPRAVPVLVVGAVFVLVDVALTARTRRARDRDA